MSSVVVFVLSFYFRFIHLYCESRPEGVWQGTKRKPRSMALFVLDIPRAGESRSRGSGGKSLKISISEWRQFRFIQRPIDPFSFPFSMCALESVFLCFCSCRLPIPCKGIFHQPPPYLLPSCIF